MEKIILASQSPRRKKLLKQLIGNNFEIIETPFKEDNNQPLEPQELVKTHSIGKAREVAKSLKEGIVIGSDTFLYFNNSVLGKPKTQENAIKMLQELNGNTIEVYSGLGLINAKTREELIEYTKSEIQMKKMTKEEILKYVITQQPLGNAGSFNIDEKGAILIEEIKGEYSSIVGLPLFKLNQMLKKFGINILEYE